MLRLLTSPGAEPGTDSEMGGRRTVAKLFLPIAALFLVYGCASEPVSNNTDTAPAGDANANIEAEPPVERRMDSSHASREPERFSALVQLKIERIGGEGRPDAPPLQFEFARLRSDRRLNFDLPGMGQVHYLEKSGLKYLVLPGRKQYVELTPEEIGVGIPETFSPGAMVDQILNRTRSERLGTEIVNGRRSIKYRIDGSEGGEISGDGFLFVDETSGLPLRAELTTGGEGRSVRVTMDLTELHLNPPAETFEVAEGMKKVTVREASQQLRGFLTALSRFIEAIDRRDGSAPGNANR